MVRRRRVLKVGHMTIHTHIHTVRVLLVGLAGAVVLIALLLGSTTGGNAAPSTGLHQPQSTSEWISQRR
jgi:hypothetical protein